MTKVNRNDKCLCNSGKKYKVCCLEKDRKLIQDQKEEKANYVSSNKISEVKEVLENNFKNFKILDVTNTLDHRNYKEHQIKNFNKNIIMIMEETNNNKLVFEKRRVEPNDDILLLYNGNYRLLKSSMIYNYIDNLKLLLSGDPLKMKFEK
jgi:uncharacterized protein YecA (UPF0149 family)